MRRGMIWSGFVLGVGLIASQPSFAAGTTVSILMRDGTSIEGTIQEAALKATINGKMQTFGLNAVLSVEIGDAASSTEAARIAADLAALQGTDRAAQDAATEQLTDIGLPVLTPLLESLKDTDAHEPKPLYRLFERIMPSIGDNLDRTLDMIRLANGEIVRGKIAPETTLTFTASGGTQTKIARQLVRRLAVRRKEVKRTLTVHSLYHCNQVAWLDTGIALSPDSQVDSTAQGFLRLAYNVDGWTMDPDGLKKPGPNYNTNLTNGFPFGALLTKTGASGKQSIAGQKMSRTDLGTGKLYFSINDNPHWQNNLGTYRMTLKVTNAYDLGEPQ